MVQEGEISTRSIQSAPEAKPKSKQTVIKDFQKPEPKKPKKTKKGAGKEAIKKQEREEEGSNPEEQEEFSFDWLNDYSA